MSTEKPEVQGWEIYDNPSATAMIILVVHRRYAMLIEHTAAKNTHVALSKFTNVQGLKKGGNITAFYFRILY